MRVERVNGICGPRGALSSIDFQPHSEHRETHRLATSGGPTIKIWSLEWPCPQSAANGGPNNVKWQCLYTNSSHSPYDVVLVRFSFDGRLLLSVNSRGTVIILKMKTPRVINVSANNCTSNKLELPANVAISACTTAAGEDWLAMDELVWPSEIGQVADACWAPDNRSVAGGGSSGVAVLDIYTRQVVAMFGVPGTGGCVVESVKSLSWDPMTIFIAITCTTSFSMWRRAKNDSSNSYHKWTFTLEKYVPTHSLSQLISYRPSWCPRGRLVSVPLESDLDAKNAVKNDAPTMGCNVYMIDKPENGSSVTNSPMRLLGHVNKVTNVRFSSDILKFDEYLGGAKVALFAQTSEDGVLSVWTLGFDGNNSKCLVAVSSLLDEQVAVSDLAWGNRGSWLAIAQTCGGIILLDFKHSDINATFYTNWMRGRRVPDTSPPQIEADPNSPCTVNSTANTSADQNIDGYTVISKGFVGLGDYCGNRIFEKHSKIQTPLQAQRMVQFESTRPVYYEVITCLLALPSNSGVSDDEMTWLDMDSTQLTTSLVSAQIDSVENITKAPLTTPSLAPTLMAPAPIVQDKRGKRGKVPGKPNITPSTTLPVHTLISPTRIAMASCGVVTLMNAEGNLWKPVFTINVGREVLVLSNDNGYLAIITKANDVPSVTVVIESTGQVVMATNLLGESLTRDSVVRTKITATSLVIAIFNRGKSFTINHLSNGIFTRVIEMGNQQKEFLHKVTGFAILDTTANINYQQRGSLHNNDSFIEIDLLVCIFKTSDGHVHLCPAVGKSIGRALPLDVGKVETPPANGPDALKECFKICSDRSTRPSLMAVASCLLGNTTEFTYWYSSLLSQLIKEQRIDLLFRAIETLFKSKILPLETSETLVIDDKIDNPLYRRFLKQLPLNLEKIADGLIYPILRGEFKGLPGPIPGAHDLLANIPMWIREIQLSQHDSCPNISN